MLTLKLIQEQKDLVIKRLAIKNFDAKDIIDQVISLDEKRKATQLEVDNKQAEMNSLSKKIGQLFKEQKMDEANTAKAKTAELKEAITSLNNTLSEAQNSLTSLLIQIPNIPNEIVTPGKGEEENVVLKTIDTPILMEGKLPHWELAKKYDIIDFELGVKITGAGFPVYKGKALDFNVH
ncbi:MAG: hypothetical protein WBG43_08415 [Marinifilaceae bacterium]